MAEDMAENINDDTSGLENVLSSSQSKSSCAFCVEKTSKYTCPRCNVRYCSTVCYKSEKHLRCSELFYKECVMKEMSEEEGSSENKRKMIEMLKKLEEQDREAEDDLDIEDLEERLGEIDINSAEPEAVWLALTDKERKEFELAVKSGEISKVIDIWVPWWSLRDDSKTRKKIEDISDESSAANKDHIKPEAVKEKRDHQIPPVKRNFPPLSLVMKNSTPNPKVQFSCVDVLFSYAYVMRLYNGCPEDTLEQAAESLLQLSPVLSQNAVFESVHSVVHNSLGVVQQCKNLYCSEELCHLVLLDIIALIEGHAGKEEQNANFVECALSHLCRLLSGGREKLKEMNSNMNQEGKDLHKSMWLAKKKAEFLLAWVQSNTTILPSLVLNIKAVHTELSVTHKQHKEQTEKLEHAWGGTRPPNKTSLITEI